MRTAVFEGGLDGLISLASFLYATKTDFDRVSNTPDGDSLFSENIYYERSTWAEMAESSFRGGADIKRLEVVFLGDTDRHYAAIVKHVIESLSDKATMETESYLDESEHSIRREAHKYKGFVRFEETDIGFFARIAPKYDILPLIAGHFFERYGDNRIIYDEKRKKAAVISQNGYEIVNASAEKFETSTSEKRFTALWKKFFDSITIDERENKKLQQSFAPKRYREHMPEFAS